MRGATWLLFAQHGARISCDLNKKIVSWGAETYRPVLKSGNGWNSPYANLGDKITVTAFPSKALIA